jgi:hypothetical protein
MSCPISHCAKPSEKVGCFDRDDRAQGWTVVLDLVCCVPRHLVVSHEIEAVVIETKPPICPVSVFRQPKKPVYVGSDKSWIPGHIYTYQTHKPPPPPRSHIHPWSSAKTKERKVVIQEKNRGAASAKTPPQIASHLLGESDRERKLHDTWITSLWLSQEIKSFSGPLKRQDESSKGLWKQTIGRPLKIHAFKGLLKRLRLLKPPGSGCGNS